MSSASDLGGAGRRSALADPDEVVAAPRTRSGSSGSTRLDRRSLYSRVVNSEFNWWLLIVGLVVGAGLVWLVVADSRRREVDVGEAEREGEARWIAEAMTDAGRRVDDDDVLDILRLHAAYLAAAPPDEPDDEAADDSIGTEIPGWVAVPDRHAEGRDTRDRRTMAHPAGPDQADAEGGPA